MKYKILIASILVAFLAVGFSKSTAKKNEKPNVIIIFTDDQGYNDVGCYNSPKIKTPNLDKMAFEGIRTTNFYVSSSICSPSRASLLTGRYSFRNGVGGVFFPDNKGMKAEEITLAEILKTNGYKTACFGKWHLGDIAGHLPTDQGFDEYFGIPYSNDMYIGKKQAFAENVTFRDGYTLEKAKEDQVFNGENKRNRKAIKEKGIKELCPLMEGSEIVEYPCDQATLTKRYFERAMKFVDKVKDEPFFMYITPAMPHVPLFASEKFKGTSERGLYGDVIEEIDYYIGELLEYLKEKDLDENTMVIFTSDNGPWLGYKDHAGSAAPLRDGKFTNYEGGVRVPCIFHWPGKWEAGKTSDQILSTLDFLPTIAHYTGASLPETEIDGYNISNHLEDVTKKAGAEIMYYTKNKSIYGVRVGDWKYLPNSGARKAKPGDTPELFNLKLDVSEKNNVYDKYPEKVKELEVAIAKKRASLKNK